MEDNVPTNIQEEIKEEVPTNQQVNDVLTNTNEVQTNTQVNVVKSQVSNEDVIDDDSSLFEMPSLSKEEIQTVHEKCVVCNSKFRKEAEDVWEKYHKTSLVVRFLEEKGEKFRFPLVRNHCLNHYSKFANTVGLKEYSEELVKWVQNIPDGKKALKRRIALLEREMHFLGSQANGLEMVDRIKGAEQIRKISETLLSYQQELKEIDTEEEKIVIIFKFLTKVFKQKLLENKDNEKLKEIISDIVSQLNVKMRQLKL